MRTAKLNNFNLTTPPTILDFLPEKILEFDTLTSTNDYLKTAAANEVLTEGTLVWALNQTQGRGQRENVWLVEPGKNLTISILLTPPKYNATQAFLLSKALALAVYKTIQQFIPKSIGIKWPNDIYCDDKKISGILIENNIQGEYIRQCIVGIGLNVNQTVFENNNSTSLKIITNKDYSIREVLNVLIGFIRFEYLRILSGDFKNVEEAYFDCLLGNKKNESFLIHNKIHVCDILEIQPDGAIVLLIDGKKEVYLHGDAYWKNIKTQTK